MEEENSIHSIERSGMRGIGSRRRKPSQTAKKRVRRTQNDLKPSVRPKKGSSNTKRYLIIGFIVLSIVVFFISTTFASSKISLTLASTDVTLDAAVTATRAPTQSGDISFEVRTPSPIIKSQTITNFEREAERTRAKGIVTIYNTATTGEKLDLVSRTRFLTPDGNLYRLLGRQSIPGGKTIDGEFVAGSKEVQVEADEVGDSFNLEANVRISIPGLAKFKEFGESYAITETRIVGGFDGERFIPDVEEERSTRLQLRKEIEKELREKLIQSLSTNSLSERVVFENGIFIVFEDLENEQTETSVIIKEKGVLRAIEFREADLASFLVEKVGDLTVSNVRPTSLDIENLKFETQIESDEVHSAKELAFRISGQAKLYWGIDNTLLRNDLSGKKKDAVNDIIADLYPQVVKIEKISLFPIWKTSFPGNKSKIKIEVKY